VHHERSESPMSERAPETGGRTIRWWARFYDVVSCLLSLGRMPAIRKTIVELAGVAPGDKVVDVGCGTGSLAIAAKGKAGPAGEVHGIDAAPEMIEVARRNGANAGVDVGLHVGLIEDMPFPDGQFDLALSSFVLHHLPQNLKRKGFAEVHRVLKPGGSFLAVDLATRTNSLIGHIMTALIGHEMMHSDVSELLAMMGDAGFTEVKEVKTKYKQLLFVRGKAEKQASTAQV
jgi:ubiquinone/menaquinone biosynthesis C-methylase UbiE